MPIDELIIEAIAAENQFWFIQWLQIKERTDSTVTLHFVISSDLFVQVFYSQRSERLSFALVGAVGRLYGRDKERGKWHLHPYGEPDQHKPMPEGMSPQPIMQFLAEVERILIEHGLL